MITALSVAKAAFSTSGLVALTLQPDVPGVIVLAHGDEAGKTAAHHPASGWKPEDRRVRIANPPERMDFDDMLLGREPSIQGDE